MQRLQVLSVVNEATSNLAALMAAHQPRSSCLGLEVAMTALHGSEQPSEDVIARIEAKVAEGRDMLIVSSEPEIPLRDPDQVLLDALRNVGSTASRMLPENRLVAQRFLAAGMEMMMLGGSLMPEYLADQLAPFAGIAQERATRRISVKLEESEAWLAELTLPLRELLRQLLKLGLIESSHTTNGEVMHPRPDSRQCFAALRRFFHPSTTASGVEDALRRAVNRNQRLRPQFSCAKSFDTGSTCLETDEQCATSRSPSSRGSSTAVGSSIADAAILASPWPALQADQQIMTLAVSSPNLRPQSLTHCPAGWASGAVRACSAPRQIDLDIASPAFGGRVSGTATVAMLGASPPRRSSSSVMCTRAPEGLPSTSPAMGQPSQRLGSAASRGGLILSSCTGASDGSPAARPRSPIVDAGAQVLLARSPIARRRSNSLAATLGRH
mmetsp:Transcript_27854/g.70003  ORF Transcript_27854/g.70003 Transcript_27854/m.70003 type:complete len:441 (+) Transcript_27854:411-1733(+)